MAPCYSLYAWGRLLCTGLALADAAALCVRLNAEWPGSVTVAAQS